MVFQNTRHTMLFLGISAALILAGCNVGATPAPTVDVNAINTAIVGTTVAQLSGQMTQTAQAQPSSTVPAPTNTAASLPTFSLPTVAGALPTTAGALPTISFNTTPLANTPVTGFTAIAPTSAANGTKVGCNDAQFVAETLKDGSTVTAGKTFDKVWQIQNTGTCTWDDGYVFAFQANQSTPGINGYDIVINKKDEFTAPGHSQSFIITLTAPTTPGEYKGFWKLKTDDGTYFGPLVYFDIIVK